MTIKTLTYIHNLLKEDVQMHKDAKNNLRALYREALDEEKANADFLENQYNIEYDKLRAAEDALEDFESQEW